MNWCWLGCLLAASSSSRIIESVEASLEPKPEESPEESLEEPEDVTEGDQAEMDELKLSSICDLLLSCDKSWKEFLLDVSTFLSHFLFHFSFIFFSNSLSV